MAGLGSNNSKAANALGSSKVASVLAFNRAASVVVTSKGANAAGSSNNNAVPVAARLPKLASQPRKGLLPRLPVS